MNTDYYTDDINDSEELNHIQKKLHNIFNDKVQVHVSMPKTYRNSNITAFHQDYKTKLINGFIDKKNNYYKLHSPIEKKK